MERREIIDNSFSEISSKPLNVNTGAPASPTEGCIWLGPNLNILISVKFEIWLLLLHSPALRSVRNKCAVIQHPNNSLLVLVNNVFYNFIVYL